MGHSPISGPERNDRLSHLDDTVVGHILSFLDGVEVGRATALSRRWRDVLAIVHTVSLEEPKPPLVEYGEDIWSRCTTDDPTDPPSFQDAVTGALFARSRRPAPGPAAVPLRALRVSMRFYNDDDDKIAVDQWVSYALKHAAPALALDLRLSRHPVCERRNVAAAMPQEHNEKSVGEKPLETDVDGDSLPGHPDDDDDGDDVGSSSSSEEKSPTPRHLRGYREYIVPWGLFSCAALRSLRLGSCRLSPPAAFSMPTLETLHLTHVPDEEGHVQRLVLACPRLADLTLEACGTVTTLSLLHNTRLRRLALRCCHKLATVAVDASELCSFEYRGAVPEDTFLTARGGGGGFPYVTSCKVDICTVCVMAEASSTSEEELVKLGSFLQKFASTEQLHLCSNLMGSCFVRLPAFPILHHLQLHGHVPHDDDPAAAAADMSRILSQAPNLETLSLFFEVKRRHRELYDDYCYFKCCDADLLDAHHLHYNQYETLDVPVASVPVPACLGSRVRKINLLHYQGGRAQRTLGRFLLRGAAALEKLYCGFAEGPRWIEAELTREMEGWVINETASKEFR